MGAAMFRALLLLVVTATAPRPPQAGKVGAAIATAARAPGTFASGLSNSLRATFGRKFGGYSRALATARNLSDERLQKMQPHVLADLADTLRRPGLFGDRAAGSAEFMRVVTARGHSPGQVMGVLSRLGIHDASQLPKHLTAAAREELSKLIAPARPAIGPASIASWTKPPRRASGPAKSICS